MAGRARSVLATLVIAAAVGAGMATDRYSQAQSSADEATITGFSIPEVDDTGQLQWKVLGEYARLDPSGGPVDITKMRMEMYKDSQVDMVLTSPRCLYDRDKHEAATEAPVQITGKNLLITGDGFFWSATNSLLVIRRNAHVYLSNAKSWVKPETNSVATMPSTQENAK